MRQKKAWDLGLPKVSSCSAVGAWRPSRYVDEILDAVRSVRAGANILFISLNLWHGSTISVDAVTAILVPTAVILLFCIWPSQRWMPGRSRRKGLMPVALEPIVLPHSLDREYN